MRTEIFAGITMFIASVYILAVIPNLLVASGMPHESTVAAVILTTAFTTILIGLVANVPVIVAPGLGLSAFFAYTICGSMGLTWQTALGAVFISGAVFIVLTITRILNLIIDSIPKVLKTSIGVGIGLFIAFIGFKKCSYYRSG
ncbi:MAG: solute carrier family 23 protein [Veillonella sp.]